MPTAVMIRIHDRACERGGVRVVVSTIFGGAEDDGGGRFVSFLSFR